MAINRNSLSFRLLRWVSPDDALGIIRAGGAFSCNYRWLVFSNVFMFLMVCMLALILIVSAATIIAAAAFVLFVLLEWAVTNAPASLSAISNFLLNTGGEPDDVSLLVLGAILYAIVFLVLLMGLWLSCALIVKKREEKLTEEERIKKRNSKQLNLVSMWVRDMKEKMCPWEELE